MKIGLLKGVSVLGATLGLAAAGGAKAWAQTEAGALSPAQRDAEIRAIHDELHTLEARLAALEQAEAASAAPAPLPPTAATQPAPAPPPTMEGMPPTMAGMPSMAAPPQPVAPVPGGMLAGTTFAFGLDGYYLYNDNQPIGQVNYLRAYDVSSNSFSISQVSLIAEHLPTEKERVGGRLDLQFGQATETLQGSSANEIRPQVWRNLYQAYGSYLAPVGSGLQLDFGKWASSLGSEGNYTKDQVAYSRSFSFLYLPFYHMGLRATYNVTPKASVTYWLVNGANDTEDWNGFKSQNFGFMLKPAASLTWMGNYYFGEEARGLTGSNTTEPTQPGLPTANITPAPNGREHIFDTYAQWQVTPRLLLAPEADYVINRTYAESQPGHTAIGLLNAKYSLPHDWSLGARFEYVDDRSGLFSGTSQALKEGTAMLDRVVAEHFLIRGEYRRDFSNRPFFLGQTPGVLLQAQPTTTLGLVYWFGNKQGAW